MAFRDVVNILSKMYWQNNDIGISERIYYFILQSSRHHFPSPSVCSMFTGAVYQSESKVRTNVVIIWSYDKIRLLRNTAGWRTMPKGYIFLCPYVHNKYRKSGSKESIYSATFAFITYLYKEHIRKTKGVELRYSTLHSSYRPLKVKFIFIVVQRIYHFLT